MPRHRNTARTYIVRERIASVCAVLLAGFHATAVLADTPTTTSATPAISTYSDPRPLIAEAIRTGQAHGRISGPIATLFARQFHPSGPLDLTITVDQRLPQPNCARLKMAWSQAGVPTPNGPDTAELDTRLNICADGSPPGDLEQSR